MKELIGKKFKRNKYGLSDWTDEVVSVEIGWSLTTDFPKSLKERYRVPIIFIIGKKNGYAHTLDEIVIVEE